MEKVEKAQERTKSGGRSDERKEKGEKKSKEKEQKGRKEQKPMLE